MSPRRAARDPRTVRTGRCGTCGGVVNLRAIEKALEAGTAYHHYCGRCLIVGRPRDKEA